MQRRFFLRQAAIGGGLLLVPGLAQAAISTAAPKLTILHTNDWHSRIEPFPDDGGRNANKGGAVRRMQLISEVRAQESNVLLLDSGDIFQGTPYFNFFAGELEMKLMSQMKYDAATIGNHDFDWGRAIVWGGKFCRMIRVDRECLAMGVLVAETVESLYR